MGSMSRPVGPVSCAVFGFPGSNFKGAIAPALADLVDKGTIRVLDLVFAIKDQEGDVAVVELQDLDDEQRAPWAGITDDPSGLLTEEDGDAIADALEPGDAAAMLIWEDVWAGPFAQAV
ncbi:MAG: hypothetical protein EHM63_07225, partial [Actinobacteria bacterium]